MTAQQKRQRFGVFLTVAGGITWGFSGCCGQYLFTEKGVTAVWLVGVRLLLAGAILCAVGIGKFGLRNHFSVFRSRKDMAHFLLYALLGITLNQYTYFLAVEASNAGTATVLQYVFPALVLGYVCMKAHRKPSIAECSAILLVFCGVFLLGTGGSFTSLRLTPAALFWGFMSVVSVTIYNLLAGSLVSRYGVYSILGTGMMLGGLLTLPISKPWLHAPALDAGVLFGIFGVAVLGTAIAYSFYLLGVSLIGPLKASLLACVEPVASVILSAVWLRTSFVPTDYAGFVCILLNLFILNRPKAETCENKTEE